MRSFVNNTTLFADKIGWVAEREVLISACYSPQDCSKDSLKVTKVLHLEEWQSGLMLQS